MKKILVLAAVVLITDVANAQTEYYMSPKLGGGNVTMYAQGDTKATDLLVQTFNELDGAQYKYSNSSMLWNASVALGVDWSLTRMYVKKNPYDWFHVRLEGEFGYNNYREEGKLKDNYIIKHNLDMKIENFFILANGYADFQIDSFVPYIGLGLGYSFEKQELSVQDINYNDYVDDSGMIYALHAGAGYKYSDITTFDFGYRRVYSPTEGDGLNVFSSVRFGARFRI